MIDGFDGSLTGSSLILIKVRRREPRTISPHGPEISPCPSSSMKPVFTSVTVTFWRCITEHLNNKLTDGFITSLGPAGQTHIWGSVSHSKSIISISMVFMGCVNIGRKNTTYYRRHSFLLLLSEFINILQAGWEFWRAASWPSVIYSNSIFPV